MPLSPDDIKNQAFATAMRGFDKNEVRAFLTRVAAATRQLEEQLVAAEEAANRTDDELETVVGTEIDPDDDVLSVVGQQTEGVTALEQAITDRYDALGQRIADLLRSAEESALAVRSAAEEEARSVKAQAEAEASQLLAEARAMNDEADRHRTEAVEQARSDVEDQRRSAEQDRAAAAEELAAARGQSAEVLEQARAQSEFLQREAEEIIRAKVRSNLEQAQRRIDLLRNTEVASRERIAMAQRELESALGRLETTAAPSLDPENGQSVIDDARSALAATDARPVDEIIEAQESSDPESSPATLDDHDEAGGSQNGSSSIHTVDDTEDHDADDDHINDDHVDVGGGETATSAEEEDALAKLVREAMQEAVDSARKSQ